MASHYPRGRITTTACVLLCLGYLLLRLPLDQKSYAKESSKFLRKDNEESEEPKPKGGMVRLNELKSVPVNHDGSGAMKQTMILNGQVPHLTGFSRAVFAPGDEVELHWHKSKDEVFYSTEGKGVIEVDGAVVQALHQKPDGVCNRVAADAGCRMAS